MSESTGPTVEWVVSAGSILGIIVSITVVAAAVWRIISVIRKKVTSQVIANRDEAREMFARIEKQISGTEQLLKENMETKVTSGRQRFDDMKFWVEKLQDQVEKNRQDVDRNREEIYRRIEQGDLANQKILDRINDLSSDVARIKGMVERVERANGVDKKHG